MNLLLTTDSWWQPSLNSIYASKSNNENELLDFFYVVAAVEC